MYKLLEPFRRCETIRGRRELAIREAADRDHGASQNDWPAEARASGRARDRTRHHAVRVRVHRCRHWSEVGCHAEHRRKVAPRPARSGRSGKDLGTFVVGRGRTRPDGDRRNCCPFACDGSRERLLTDQPRIRSACSVAGCDLRWFAFERVAQGTFRATPGRRLSPICRWQ